MPKITNNFLLLNSMAFYEFSQFLYGTTEQCLSSLNTGLCPSFHSRPLSSFLMNLSFLCLSPLPMCTFSARLYPHLILQFLPLSSFLHIVSENTLSMTPALLTFQPPSLPPLQSYISEHQPQISNWQPVAFELQHAVC